MAPRHEQTAGIGIFYCWSLDATERSNSVKMVANVDEQGRHRSCSLLASKRGDPDRTST